MKRRARGADALIMVKAADPPSLEVGCRTEKGKAMDSYEPGDRTRVMARIVGPYLVIVAMMLLVRGAVLPDLLPAFMQDGPLVLATGAFTLMAGLAVLAVHHHWRGAAAFAISLIGVVVALKGALLMLVPTLGAELTAAVARSAALLIVVAVIALLAGLWLTFVGWRSRP